MSNASLSGLIRNEDGLETIEYAVMTALIVAGLILSITALGMVVIDRISATTSNVEGM